LAWAIFPIIFFTASKSKLPGYILPVIPPLALLAAARVGRVITCNRRAARWPLILLGFLFIAAAAKMLQDSYVLPKHTSNYWVLLVGLQCAVYFSIFAIVLGVVIIAAACWRAIFALTLSLISLLAILSLAGGCIRGLDRGLSARWTAERITALGPAQVYEFQLHPARLYQLNFYFHREVPEWTPAQIDTVVVVTPRNRVNDLKNYARIVDVISAVYDDAYILRIAPLTAQASP
jgi:hypothetical protein